MYGLFYVGFFLHMINKYAEVVGYDLDSDV